MLKKDFISITDLSKNEFFQLFNMTEKIKRNPENYQTQLKNLSIGIIMQKPSTRTVTSFAVGVYQLGGMPVILSANEMQWKRGESIADTARTLSKYLQAIVIRANRHSDVEELKRYSTVPVINGLTDEEHPCQVLSDFFTIKEIKQKINDLKICYIGDSNNVTNSLLFACAILDIKIIICSPKEYQPPKTILERAAQINKNSFEIEENPKVAVKDADVVYTDVWASMGKEEEAQQRKLIFKEYQVNLEILKLAKQDIMVMHCLPAKRGEEITDEVIDGKNSYVWQQAENRLHLQKALLIYLIKGSAGLV